MVENHSPFLQSHLVMRKMYQDNEAMAGVPFVAEELSQQLLVAGSWFQSQMLEIVVFSANDLGTLLRKSIQMGQGMS